LTRDSACSGDEQLAEMVVAVRAIFGQPNSI
jgi:hypothetical protein